MLAFLTNLGLPEIVVIVVIAVLIFGKDLPQAASKAYLQVRKFRNAVDDLRRDSGIERELREIERNVREAEWEARRSQPAAAEASRLPGRPSLPSPPVEPVAGAPPSAEESDRETPDEEEPPTAAPTDSAS